MRAFQKGLNFFTSLAKSNAPLIFELVHADPDSESVQVLIFLIL